MYKYLGSSQNPEKLALRVSSALYAIIPAVVLIAKLKGVELTDTDLKPYVEAIYNVIIYGGFLVTGLLHVYGWFRALFKK